MRCENSSYPRASRLAPVAFAFLFAGCAAVDPITTLERSALAKDDIALIRAEQEPVQGTITLYTAMARALKYNLDSRVDLAREHFASGDYTLAKFDLLPSSDLDGGYEGRSNTQASSSESVLTGTQSLEPSTSLDNNRGVVELTTVWSALDLGASYLRLKQKKNQIYIAREARRTTINSLTREVRRTYWRLAAANAISGELSRLRAAASRGIQRARQAEAEGLESAEAAVEFERRMLRIIKATTVRQRELALARAELAALMGLDPATTFRIGGARFVDHRTPGVEHRTADLRSIALIHRPELYEADYKARIASLEKSIDIITALPSVQANLDINADSNSFLVNEFWVEYGAKLVGSIPRLLSLPARIERADARNALADEQRRALTMAVISQVHIAHQAYHDKQREFALAQRLTAAERRNFQIQRDKERDSLANESAFLEAWAQFVQARLDTFGAFAEYQEAYARLLESVGVDFTAVDLTDTSVAGVSAGLRGFFSGGSSAVLRQYWEDARRIEREAMAAGA